MAAAGSCTATQFSVKQYRAQARAAGITGAIYMEVEGWPVCTLAAPLGRWVDAARALLSGASADETARLFGRNAERVFRIG